MKAIKSSGIKTFKGAQGLAKYNGWVNLYTLKILGFGKQLA